MLRISASAQPAGTEIAGRSPWRDPWHQTVLRDRDHKALRLIFDHEAVDCWFKVTASMTLDGLVAFQ